MVVLTNEGRGAEPIPVTAKRAWSFFDLLRLATGILPMFGQQEYKHLNCIGHILGCHIALICNLKDHPFKAVSDLLHRLTEAKCCR
jgi:hypothetical protein